MYIQNSYIVFRSLAPILVPMWYIWIKEMGLYHEPIPLSYLLWHPHSWYCCFKLSLGRIGTRLVTDTNWQGLFRFSKGNISHHTWSCQRWNLELFYYNLTNFIKTFTWYIFGLLPWILQKILIQSCFLMIHFVTRALHVY